MKKYYVIQNNRGKFLKVDNASGGYPCFIEDFEFCEKFNSKELAEEFLASDYATRMFKKQLTGCIVKIVKMVLE